MVRLVKTCATCGTPFVHLVCHHWYEPPRYEYHDAYVCVGCNRCLLPTNVWRGTDTRIRTETRKWYHVLPSLDIQREWLDLGRAGHKLFVNKLRGSYGFPLPDRPHCTECGSYLMEALEKENIDVGDGSGEKQVWVCTRCHHSTIVVSSH